MWRANRLVDALAKLAAFCDRVPDAALRELAAATALVKHSCALLGNAIAAVISSTVYRAASAAYRRQTECGVGLVGAAVLSLGLTYVPPS